MSIVKKISVNNAIQSAMDLMGDQDSRMIPIYLQWAVQAEQKIGSYYQYKKKIKVIDVADCRAALPCDAVAVTGILFGNQGCECDTLFHNVYNNFGSAQVRSTGHYGFLVLDVAGGNVGCSTTRWEVQNNNIVFDSKFQEDQVTIQYLGYETDEDEIPLVNENHIDAIAHYLQYMRAQRERWNRMGVKFSRSEIRDMQLEWSRLARSAKAEDAEPSESERAEIVSMVNDPLSGMGIALWNYNDIYYNG